ncbi:MAG: family 16 glycosylhydrolase [Saprospiraceae bacterium]
MSVTDGVYLEDENIQVEVRLESPASKDISVQFETLDGTAIAPEDYEPANGTMSFAPGEVMKTIAINQVRDTIREDDEYFYIKLSAATNASIGNEFAKITLRNDDTFFPVTAGGYTTPESYPGYDLEWSDEFNANELNTSDWTFDLGDGCPNCGWGNNELEWYTDKPENVFLSNGYLILEARRESLGGKEYTSSRIKTQGLKNFQYGRIDIRALMPVGQGIWPAIWMLGENITDVGWPACGEIDIMEYLGHEPGIVHGTGHWGSSVSSHAFQGNSIQPSGDDYATAFHVFSIEWKENEIKWLMDNQQYFILDSGITGDPFPYNAPFFFILNVAVGGDWPGSPDANTSFPQQMVVDYIRVFKKQ